MTSTIHARFAVQPTHPALPGHFPGRPIVPGVVLLEMILESGVDVLVGGRLVGISSAKFLRPLRPAELIDIELASERGDGAHSWKARFKGYCDGIPVVEGALLFSDGTGAPAHLDSVNHD